MNKHRNTISLLLAAVLFSSCHDSHQKVSAKIINSVEQNGEDDIPFEGLQPAKVAVLGTFHFANPPGHDFEEQFYVDVLSDAYQAQIEEVINRLEAFAPTKILIERNRIRYQDSINHQYQDFLLGNFSIKDKSDEVYQIAFPLAARLGHPTVLCSDADAKWFGADLDWARFDEDSYLKEQGQFDKSYRYDYNPFYAKYDSLKAVLPLSEFLYKINLPSNRLIDHQAYLTGTALTGAGDNYIGADALSRWYRRNIRIYSNTYDLADFNAADRILLIYGSGHVWQLRQLFCDSPDFEYVEASSLLTN